jgi:hypothetical protein
VKDELRQAIDTIPGFVWSALPDGSVDFLVERTILEHHKLSASGADPSWLVEPFRKADWIDVSRGTLTFGLSNRTVGRILSTSPSAGFHQRLLQLAVKRPWTNPLAPLPMLKR